MAAVGRIVRMRRKTLGLTQAALVKRARRCAGPGVGLGQVTVSRIEKSLPVFYRSLMAVAAALSFDLAQMGVSPLDLAAIEAEEALRLEMEALLRTDGRAAADGSAEDGTLKSGSDYAVYAPLSGYRNKPTQAAAAIV